MEDQKWCLEVLWRLQNHIQNHPKMSITEKRRNKAEYLTWISIRLFKFGKKTNVLVKSHSYIKFYSLSCPRPVKSPRCSIRYNCQKICSWSKNLKPYWKSKKRPHWSTVTYPEFFGQTSTYIEPTKASSWVVLSKKKFKFVPPNILKMHSLAPFALRFLCKTFSKLLNLHYETLLWG